MVLDFDTKAGADLNATANSYVEEGCIAWDPHASRQCAVGIGCALKLVDTREMEVANQHLTAHDEAIRYVAVVTIQFYILTVSTKQMNILHLRIIPCRPRLMYSGFFLIVTFLLLCTGAWTTTPTSP